MNVKEGWFTGTISEKKKKQNRVVVKMVSTTRDIYADEFSQTIYPRLFCFVPPIDIALIYIITVGLVS